ncbi:hypothetical protein HanIR_Chr15g0767661 [Helianthus annuus]|nr:hypothetical protein HanIR_Chr15g0767661 [Helianthus annuus]
MKDEAFSHITSIASKLNSTGNFFLAAFIAFRAPLPHVMPRFLHVILSPISSSGS